MFEHYREPLLSRPDFIMRMVRCVILAFSLLVITLLIGALVFHYVEQFSWMDAFLKLTDP